MEMWHSLSAPLHVEVALTSTCQLNCDYCSAAPFTGKHAQTERLTNLIAELGDLGVFSILLSGGEPTIHPNFFLILSQTARAIPDVVVNTNGIRLSRFRYAERFHELAPNAVVGVSLDAIDPALNDKRRGAGGRQAIQAIENLIRLGHPLCISTVLHEDNVSTADQLISRFYPNVKEFRFFPRVPRSDQEAARNNLNYWDEVGRLYERINLSSSYHPDLKVAMPFKQLSSSEGVPLFAKLQGCNCVISKAFIDSYLNIYPCYYSANSDTCYGNAGSQSFYAVWNGERAAEVRGRPNTSLCGVVANRPDVPHKYRIVPQVQRPDDMV